MSTHILTHGRVVGGNGPAWGRPRVPPARRALTCNREGEHVDCSQAIAPKHIDRTLQAGTAWHDVQEDVTYRILARIDVRDGWASTGFWQARWRVGHATILRFVRLGWLDAVMGSVSSVRRYRCRDETKVVASPYVAQARERHQEQLERQHTRREFKIRIGGL